MSTTPYEPSSSAAVLLNQEPAPDVGDNRVTRRDSAPRPHSDADLAAAAMFEAQQLKVDVIHSLLELDALIPDWQRLADHALESNPFYEPYMVIPALKHLRDEEPRPYFALVWAPHPSGRKGERLLVGMFPLVHRASGPLAPPFISLWKHSYCYLGTPLLLAPVARQALTAFFDWLQSTGALKTAMLRFEDVCGNGLFRSLLVDELHRRGFPSQVAHAYNRALFIPAKSSAEYLERALAGRRRKELRRLQSRLSEQGKLEVTVNDDPSVFAAEFIELEARGWKGRQSVAVAALERHRSHFEALCREAASRGRLMTLTMRLDGKPIAMKMNLFGATGSFAFKITYDEDYAKYSPGVLLEVENIERLHQLQKPVFMDSCAAPNRFMINHLWTERREIQTVLIASNSAVPSLTLSMIPLLKWARDHGKEAVDRQRVRLKALLSRRTRQQ